ncbi:hypothetical protein RSOLAG22IIIB_09452 [Rhizoctonia solani]|uniref:Uncharacterized protein n=1 Tax=Rhizoctonia solani TaxID=456999 RepID=A0A0K6FYQ2_9AGAM|nr:hypothetical protein RSOLAG22IIIB_09452 [Rhizoctonia solani]
MGEPSSPPRVMSPPPKRPTIDTTFSDSPPPALSQALEGSVIMDEPSELPDVDGDALKKARRQTAIYPNTLRSTPKPFSRSAAKRESVMALGSIEHLQHYFTKTGLQAKQKPMIRGKGLVPAIGGRHGVGHVRAASSVTSIPELPPSPMVPISSNRIPFVHLPKNYHVDPAQLKPGVIRDLKAVEQAWKITPEETPGTPQKFDVLDTLRITTRAIRSVRDYVVALPDDHPTHTGRGLGVYRSPMFSAPGTKKDPVVQMNLGVQSLASVLAATIPASPRRIPSSGSLRVVSPTPSLTPGSVPGSPAKPRASLPATTSTGTSTGVSTQPFPSRPEEPIALVRRAALDVLISLRSLEEKSRISGPENDSVATPERQTVSMLTAQDAHSASSRSNTPAFLSTSGDEADKESATSFPASQSQSQSQSTLPRLKTPTGAATETVLVHGRGAVQVWSESDEEDFFADEPEKKEVWDERLVLGGGWLYRQDVSLSEIQDAKLAIGRYLDIVDAMLFRGKPGTGQRGWDRERRKGRRSELATASGSETPAGHASVMSDSEDEVPGEAMRYLSVMGEQEMERLIEEDEEEGEEDESELPEWATVEPFGSDLVARTNSLLRYLLPAHLVPCLPITPARETLLNALSDGHLLCVAYNAGVRKSKKAWGFINAESIHETALATTEEKAAGSWTFRRKENLGLWAAALKLRYVIDIVPAGQTTHPTRHFHQAPQPEALLVQYAPNQFSPIVIAKHEPGWEDMLERAMWEWVNAVVTERKSVGSS